MQVKCQDALKKIMKIEFETQLEDWVFCAIYWTSNLLG